MKNQINLIDGSELECYPIALQPKVAETDNLALDTTGQYLQIGKKPHFAMLFT